MRRAAILLTVFFFLSCLEIVCPLQAQVYTVRDSAAIYKLLDDADQADLSGNLDAALGLARQALAISTEKRMKRGEGFALLKIADLALKKEGAGKVLDQLHAPLQIGMQLKDSFMIGLACQQQGQVYLNQTKYQDADNSYNKALHYYTEQKHPDYRAMILNEKGFINDRTGAYDKAAGFYLEALRLLESLNNIKEAANTTGNLAVTNFRMGNKEEAIRLFKKSASMRAQIGDAKGLSATYGNLVVAYTPISLDSALHYQQLVLQYANKTGVKSNMAQANANTAMLLTKQKKYTEAISFQQKAIELYRDVGDRLKLGNQYIGMANLANLINDSVNAESWYAQGAATAKELGNKPLLQNYYTQYADFHFKRNNFEKAYQHTQAAYNYKDSIVNEKTATNIAELQTKYETEKKDNAIARLETEQKIRQLELEKQQVVIAGNKLEAQKKETQIQLLQQQQQLRDVALAKQKDELERQVLLNKNNEQQLLLSVQQLQISENEKKLRLRQLDRERLLRNGVIAGTLLLALLGALLFNRYQLRKKIQEQDNLLQVRNRISKDLHDEIGSTLTSINILSNVSLAAVDANPGQTKQMLGDISQQSKTVQQNMSDIVWAIRPDNDRVENLAARMREYVGQTLEPQQIQTRLEVNDAALNQYLPMEHRKELLLIYKEAVNNIVKHAGATAVALKLDVQDGNVVMSIKDNGIWKGSPSSSGTGTYSMQQRAAGLGGKVTITGNGHGTEVNLVLPLP
jgi:signal transduction histidine kinase